MEITGKNFKPNAYETGSVIIDALKLCYEASAEVLEDLKANKSWNEKEIW